MSLARRIANLFSRSRIQREIDAELHSHIEMRTADNIANGMSPDAARRDALLRFGNPTAITERTASADTALTLASIAGDIRFAARQLARSPGFAWTSILTLALGIGACTAIFSAIKPILIDPLPYPHARQLMMLREMGPGRGPRAVNFATFHGLSERTQTFSSLAVMRAWEPAMTSADRPERLEGQRVSSDYFRTLGIAPILGRDFTADDDRFQGPNNVILSDTLWRRHFSADPAIIGRQVRLNDTLFTVIGVMPPTFQNMLASDAELWAPLQYNPALPVDGREWGHHLRMIGRLRSGVENTQAIGELHTILQTLGQQNAAGYNRTGGVPSGMVVNPLQKALTSGVRPALFAVLGAVFLVMLIACVNVANLLLARGSQRRAEFALRAALGAARSRVVRQLLTETILLATIGAVLGIAVAAAALRALIALSPPGLPQVHAMTIDPAALLFALAIAAIVGIILGLVPAFQLSREDLNTGMRQASRATAGARQWARRALVVSEISLAAVLLVGTGLLLRSMQHLFAVDPGFDSTHVLTMQVQTSGRRFDTDAARVRFFADALDRVRHLPGVISAGFTTQLPLSGDGDVYGMELQGESAVQQTPALRYAVTPGYIETMHIPLVRGRLLNDHDIAGASPAVLIDQSLADLKFPHQDPIGNLVRVGPDAGSTARPWATIVGVLGDVKQTSLSIGGEQAFYIPTAQWSWTDAAQTLVLRTQGDPAALVANVREAIWSIDKDQPIVQVATMESLVAASEVQRHFVLMLFEAFALAGLLLAAIGIYGVLAGSVNERTREIGVRAALGASRRSILTLIVRQGMTPVALGLFIGLTTAVLASQAIAAFLFNTSRFDVLTYAGVTALLLTVSTAACLIPARRATTINPVDALRAE